jgi:O-antigen/teichoic acid export membrane protein
VFLSNRETHITSLHGNPVRLHAVIGKEGPLHLQLPHLTKTGKKRMHAAWAVTLLSLCNWIILTVVTGMLTRHLTPTHFGWYSSALAAAGLTITLSTMGLEKLAIKAIPVFRARNDLGHWKGFLLFGNSFSIVFGVILACVAVTLWHFLSASDDKISDVFRHIMYFLPAIAVFMFLYEICSANNINIRTAAVYRILTPCIFALLIWWSIDTNGTSFSPNNVAIAYGLCWLPGLVVMAIWSWRSTPKKVFRSSACLYLKVWLLGGMGFVSFSMSLMAIGTAPVLMLTLMSPDATAGAMSVVLQVTSLLLISITATTRIFAPALANALAAGRFSQANRIRRTMLLSLLPIVVLFVTACVVFGNRILHLFGDYYGDHYDPLIIAACAMSFQAFCYLVPWEMQFRNKQRFVLGAAAIGVVAGLGLMAWFISMWEVTGAAWGQATMAVLIFLPMVIYVRVLRRHDSPDPEQT